MGMGEYLEQLAQGVRYALRQLARAPGFTIVATLTLALGIGATTAIFSAVYAVVLKPLPYREPDRLVRIYSTSPNTGISDEVAPGNFTAWRRENRTLSHIAPIETRSVTLTDGDERPERVTGIRTTADYFPIWCWP